MTDEGRTGDEPMPFFEIHGFGEDIHATSPRTILFFTNPWLPKAPRQDCRSSIKSQVFRVAIDPADLLC